jgi:ribosomal protein L37E
MSNLPYTCPHCGRQSWHPKDAEYRFCAVCGFEDEVREMTKTELYTKSGEFVAAVLVPPFNPPAEAIQYGSRVFILGADGRYREGLLYVASQ